MLRVNFLFLLVIFAFWVSACSTDDKRSDSAEGSYQIAQEFEKDERYEESIRRYQEVKNKFPYSKYATMAELSVADVYFKQESFAEAQVAYQSFKDLHPKHEQIDYVTFRLALSYFKQLPETIDRDLTLAQNAILYFEEVVTRFPQSSHATEAKEKREATLMMLAQKEEYIADFYFKKEQYDSSLGRYDDLLRKFPNLGFERKALSRASISAAKIGEMDKARAYYSELKKRYPGSDEEEAAKRELK